MTWTLPTHFVPLALPAALMLVPLALLTALMLVPLALLSVLMLVPLALLSVLMLVPLALLSGVLAGHHGSPCIGRALRGRIPNGREAVSSVGRYHRASSGLGRAEWP